MTRRVALIVALTSSVAAAQQLSRDDIASLAKVQVAITVAHDSIDARLSKAGNKKPKNQRELQDSLRAEVEMILHHGGLSEAEYQRRTYLVSTDSTARRLFDSVVVVLTGAPLPGQVARAPTVPVPAGPAGIHLGHIVNAFGDTPNGMGLLPLALAEARTALQHAQLATRQPTNLDYMKTHAGHVINAIDPTIVNAGPGLGYGLKKAIVGVARHTDLAVTAEAASSAVTMHGKQAATAAATTATRVDELLAIAQKVQAATDAAAAATLVTQMAAMAEQLGLQAVDEHVKGMLVTPAPPR